MFEVRIIRVFSSPLRLIGRPDFKIGRRVPVWARRARRFHHRPAVAHRDDAAGSTPIVLQQLQQPGRGGRSATAREDASRKAACLVCSGRHAVSPETHRAHRSGHLDQRRTAAGTLGSQHEQRIVENRDSQSSSRRTPQATLAAVPHSANEQRPHPRLKLLRRRRRQRPGRQTPRISHPRLL